MRSQEGLHAGAITIRGARCHKPDIVTEQLIIAHRGDSREHIFGRSAIGRRSAALPAIVIVLEVIPRTDTATGLLGIVIVFDAQPITHAVLLVFPFTTEQATQAAFARLGCRRGGSRNGLDRLRARRNGHRRRNGCRCGFGTLGSSKGVVDLGRGIGKVEQRRARHKVCLLHRRQRRIGDRSQRRRGRCRRRCRRRIGNIHLRTRRCLGGNLGHKGIDRFVLGGSNIGNRGTGTTRGRHGENLRGVRPRLIRLGSLGNRRHFLLLDLGRITLIGCRVLLFVRVGLDGLVLGGILDFGSINGLVIVCRVALLIGNRKGLGNCGALLFKRYRGIELRGIKRHGAIDVLLSLERHCCLNNIR